MCQERHVDRPFIWHAFKAIAGEANAAEALPPYLMLRLDVAQADLDKDTQRERALAEAEGRALEARENEDVNRRSMLTRLDEERKRTIEAINTVFANIGSGATSLLSDPVRLTTAVAGTTLLFLGIYTAREGTRVAGKAIDRYRP